MFFFCIAVMDRLAAGKRASCETKEVPPDNAAGGRVGVAAPPSSCHLPVRKVPGWRAFGFLPASWAAPKRMPGAEEAGEGVARRVCVTGVTAAVVYLSLVLAVPSRVN